MTAHATGVDAFTREWQDWHREHEAHLADRHGRLAVAGLHWLTDPPGRFRGAPGVWSAGPDGVVVPLDEGEELVVDGSPVHGEHRFGVLAERGDLVAQWGEAVIEVASR